MLVIWPREIGIVHVRPQHRDARELRWTRPGRSPKCVSRIPGISLRQLLEPRSSPHRERTRRGDRRRGRRERSCHVGVAGQGEDVGVGDRGIVGRTRIGGSGKGGRDLREDRCRSEHLRHSRQAFDLARSPRGWQRSVSASTMAALVAAPDQDAELRAGQASRVESRVVAAQPLARVDHVEIGRIEPDLRDHPYRGPCTRRPRARGRGTRSAAAVRD